MLSKKKHILASAIICRLNIDPLKYQNQKICMTAFEKFSHQCSVLMICRINFLKILHLGRGKRYDAQNAKKRAVFFLFRLCINKNEISNSIQFSIQFSIRKMNRCEMNNLTHFSDTHNTNTHSRICTEHKN